MTPERYTLDLARALHIARLKDCYGSGSQFDAAFSRQPWPLDRKEEKRLLQSGQSWMEIAIAQARAAIKFMVESEYEFPEVPFG